jgi:hypothetical protein
MNPNDLAKLMLKWADLKKELDDIEDEIASAVLEIGQSKTVGNVIATYSKGRIEYDYETAVRKENLPDVIISQYMEKVIDWRAIAKDRGIEPIVVSRRTASVSVRIKEGGK